MTVPARVLVLDDDPEIRQYLALALTGPDVEVVAIGDPSERPAGAFTVALVDVVLAGGRSAVPLIEALTADGIPVVAMTGLSETSAAVGAARVAGAREVLGKPPFTLGGLRAIVARYR